MTDFKFSNEEIIFIHKHFSDYRDTIQRDLSRQVKLSQGQLELYEKLYGGDENFDRENYELNLQLVKEEIPKAVEERMEFISNIIEKFNDAYQIMKDVDPDFVADIEDTYFDDPQAIKDIIEKLNNKNNGTKD
jgi:hypothetical protein